MRKKNTAPPQSSGGRGEAQGAAGPGAFKFCAVCGRRMLWRAKWRSSWQQVKTCSAACRRGQGPHGQALEQAILERLQARARGATICPAEAALLVFGDGRDGWPQNAMERTRQAARRLVMQGKVDVLQGGRVVDASTARGPIRLRLRDG